MSPERRIQFAETDEEIDRCFDVMRELRPHLRREDFVARLRVQQAAGYRLAFLEADSMVQSVAGFRILENLAWGRFLYIDDLATRAAAQGSGCGSGLFDWVARYAREAGCVQLHLDSGVQRHGAHRFYLHKGMDITSHHFGLRL